MKRPSHLWASTGHFKTYDSSIQSKLSQGSGIWLAWTNLMPIQHTTMATDTINANTILVSTSKGSLFLTRLLSVWLFSTYWKTLHLGKATCVLTCKKTFQPQVDKNGLIFNMAATGALLSSLSRTLLLLALYFKTVHNGPQLWPGHFWNGLRESYLRMS